MFWADFRGFPSILMDFSRFFYGYCGRSWSSPDRIQSQKLSNLVFSASTRLAATTDAFAAWRPQVHEALGPSLGVVHLPPSRQDLGID